MRALAGQLRIFSGELPTRVLRPLSVRLPFCRRVVPVLGEAPCPVHGLQTRSSLLRVTFSLQGGVLRELPRGPCPPFVRFLLCPSRLWCRAEEPLASSKVMEIYSCVSSREFSSSRFRLWSFFSCTWGKVEVPPHSFRCGWPVVPTATGGETTRSPHSCGKSVGCKRQGLFSVLSHRFTCLPVGQCH